MEFATLTPDALKDHADAFLDIASDVPGEYWTLDNFLVNLPEKWTLSFAAWDDDEPVAYAILSKKSPTSAHLHHLMVRASHRSKGLGSRMVGEMLTRVRSAGCTELTLKVETADAKRFYLRHGFAQVGPDERYTLMAKRPL